MMLAANAQFTTPQISSPMLRTGQDTAASATEGFHPWLSMNGLYRRDVDGTTPGGAAHQFYPSFAGGMSGWKSWQRRKLAGSYSGSGTHRSSILVGRDNTWTQSHTGTLLYEEQLSRQWSVGLSQLGGITYGGFGYGSAFGMTGAPGLTSGLGPGISSDPNASGLGNFAGNGVVDGELLVSQTKFSVSSGSVNYRATQRMSLSASGGAALVRRGGQQYSQDNFQGSGRIAYLLSERTQIGGDYTYGAYRYPNRFGGINNHSASLSLMLQLSPTRTISGSGGAGIMSSEFIGQVPIDPALAGLLGGTSTLEVMKTRYIIPSFQVSFIQDLPKGSFTVGASRGFNAGNGILLAGVRDSFMTAYSRPLNTRIGLTGSASYQRLSGRIGTIGVTQNMQGGVMMSIRMVGSLSFTAQAGARYLAVTTQPRRREVLAGFGLAWMPGGAPFTF